VAQSIAPPQPESFAGLKKSLELIPNELQTGRRRLSASARLSRRILHCHVEEAEDEGRRDPEADQGPSEPDGEVPPEAHRPSAPNSRLSVSDAMYPAILGFSWRRRSE
jgi:hypothetical protein